MWGEGWFEVGLLVVGNLFLRMQFGFARWRRMGSADRMR